MTTAADSSVLLDVFTSDAVFGPRSKEALRICWRGNSSSNSSAPRSIDYRRRSASRPIVMAMVSMLMASIRAAVIILWRHT